ncbi:MAG: host attachment protein [Leptothrix sp. (in: Bacteria)]|nr:host attachment protein [Leptothrix sp. (in: b-proteobacteria)]
MKKNTWVVVADEAIARILAGPSDTGELDSVEEITDPDAHAKGSEFRHDAEGRRTGGVVAKGGGAHGGAQSRPATTTSAAGEDDRHQEAERFARRVAAHLAEAFQQQRFEHLTLVAAPRFLGVLRQALSPQVGKVVTESLDKDLVHLDNQDITRRLLSKQGQTHSEAH